MREGSVRQQPPPHTPLVACGKPAGRAEATQLLRERMWRPSHFSPAKSCTDFAVTTTPSLAATGCGPDKAPGPAQSSRATLPAALPSARLEGLPLAVELHKPRWRSASWHLPRLSGLTRPAAPRTCPSQPRLGVALGRQPQVYGTRLSSCLLGRGSHHSNVGATHLPFLARPWLSIDSDLDHRFSPNFTSTHQVSHALSQRCQRFIDIQRFPRYPSTTA